MTSALHYSVTARNRTGQRRITRMCARLASLASVAVVGTLICATTVVSPAGASGSSIGSFTLTGQVVAKLKTSKKSNSSRILMEPQSDDAAWLSVGQPGTNADIINVPAGKVVLNGHSTKVTPSNSVCLSTVRATHSLLPAVS